jgi:hypothetical protein
MPPDDRILPYPIPPPQAEYGRCLTGERVRKEQVAL